MFIAVTADRLVPTAFGAQWGPAIGPLRVLAITGMVRSMARPIHSANQALGFVWRQVAIQVATVALLLAAIALGSRWGLTAASLSVPDRRRFSFVLGGAMLVRLTPVTTLDIWRAAWPSWATSAILAVAVAAVHFILVKRGVVSPGVQFAGDAIVAAIVYPVLLIWTPFRSVATVVRQSADDLVSVAETCRVALRPERCGRSRRSPPIG